MKVKEIVEFKDATIGSEKNFSYVILELCLLKSEVLRKLITKIKSKQ